MSRTTRSSKTFQSSGSSLGTGALAALSSHPREERRPVRMHTGAAQAMADGHRGGAAMRPKDHRRSLLGRVVACVTIATAVTAFCASAAAADPFGIVPGSFFAGTCAVPANGSFCATGDTPVTQAGAHPNGTTSFTLNTKVNDRNRTVPSGTLKDLQVDLPRGLVGNPLATPQCSASDFAQMAIGASSATCPPESQVGIVTITSQSLTALPRLTLGTYAVYNLVPPRGRTAQFGFTFNNVNNIVINARVRSDGDFGLTAGVVDNPGGLLIHGTSLTFWDVPADPSHDSQRCPKLTITATPTCADGGGPSSAPRVPFLTNPTQCDGTAPITTAALTSWEGDSDSGKYASPPVTGCDQLSFDPSMTALLDSTKVDSPTGLLLDLSFPQDGLLDPNGLAPAHLKRAKVTLPEGMTINPSAADGLTACTNAQMGFGNDDPVRCPSASRIGSVWATTPVLKEVLGGGVYIGSQLSDDPQSGQMFRLFLQLESEDRGLRIKLPGSIRVDAKTGQLETTFDNNPQLPVSHIRVQFKSGDRAPLATPADCGTKQLVTELDSWAGHVKYLSAPLTFQCPGIEGFSPSFMAGSMDANGGAFSPFSVQINRNDGQQYLNGVAVELPTGLLAKLDGVPLCSDADADAGTCDQSSRVGEALVGAGVGAHPFYLQGGVYLTGPYKGAPFGLQVMVPAVAGPFDLGKVVVRQKLLVDPNDAHVTIVSDPLPTIVKGVPIRLRSVNVNVNRPGFMINPTDCSEKQIKASLGSVNGTSFDVTQRFQAANCAALPLEPNLQMTLSDPTQTTDGKHPGFQAVLTQTEGQSNLKTVQVKLPLSMALDPDNAQALCKPEEAAAKQCPDGSIVGHATAWTPLLHEPLSGNVYFVEGLRTTATGQIRKTLPKLWVALRGAVALDVWADSDVDADQKLVNTFATVPDAPITKFELNIDGGEHGILVLNTDICKQGQQIADDLFDGHNGKRVQGHVTMTTPCANQAASKSVSAKKASARLRITSRTVSAHRIAVRGKVNRAASRAVKVTAACGSAKATRSVHQSRGLWHARVAVPTRCAHAAKVKLTIKYPGGPTVAPGAITRTVHQ